MQQSAKDRLSEYLPMAMENKNRLARLNDMRDAAGGLTGIPESDGSAHTAGNNHKMEAAVERYLEYEKKIQPLLKANADKMAELEHMVDSIPDGLQREVLRLRYMDAESEDTCRPKKWNAVALTLYGSDDRKYIEAVHRIHKKAILTLENTENVPQMSVNEYK